MGTPEESAAPPSGAQHSPWQSPVPYLFVGIAAMVGLIAFAVVILTCSYWRFSGDLDDGETGDVEAGEEDGGAKATPPVVKEEYLVIMAGQEKPTFLATPMCSMASSFSNKSTQNSLPFHKNTGGIQMGNP